MTCRHQKGDPNCGSTSAAEKYDFYIERAVNARAAAKLPENDPRMRAAIGLPETPDASAYRIRQVQRVGPHLVLKVEYPNCRRCSYDGVKVLVLLNVTAVQAMMWRRMDPHFRDPKNQLSGDTEAPSPAARFPASEEGWKDALQYASLKIEGSAVSRPR